MYEQVEKTNENKSRAVANNVAQKKSSVRQVFGFTDNRNKKGENAAQMQIKDMRTNSGDFILQRKIVDLDGMQLSKASPESIGMENSTYASLWTKLNEAETKIYCLPTSSQSSYDPKTKALYFHKTIIDDLLRSDTAPDAKVSHIAAITHEMSHASDHVLYDRELGKENKGDEHMKLVIATELRAWSKEALMAWEASERLSAMDKEKGKLINAWQEYHIDMLNDIDVFREINPIMDRLWTYIRKGIVITELRDVSEWAANNRGYIDGEISRLRPQIGKYLFPNVLEEEATDQQQKELQAVKKTVTFDIIQLEEILKKYPARWTTDRDIAQLDCQKKLSKLRDQWEKLCEADGTDSDMRLKMLFLLDHYAMTVQARRPAQENLWSEYGFTDPKVKK